MAPFVETRHVFQNLGDGTYFHSGQLAMQAAIGAGANITYKLLYNDTVAMTGGQETSFRLGVPRPGPESCCCRVCAEVVITADDVGRYTGARCPAGGDGSGPRRDRRGPADAGRCRRGHRADPRSGMRRRVASGAQARHVPKPTDAGRDQPSHLRGLWRLRRGQQLPRGAAGRHAARRKTPIDQPAATSTSRASVATVRPS